VSTTSQDYRIAVGDFVRSRLSGLPNAFRMPVGQADLYVVRDVLTADECAGLIALIDYGRFP
jgi:hypothetical protein